MPQDQAGDRMNGMLKALPIPVVVALLAGFGAYFAREIQTDTDIRTLETAVDARLNAAVASLRSEMADTRINVAENYTELRIVTRQLQRLQDRCESYLDSLRNSAPGGP